MRKLFLIFIIALFTLSITAQNRINGFDFYQFGVTVEQDKRLMVVLASLEVAGLKTPLSEQGIEFREKLLNDLSDTDSSLRERMTTFIVQYRKAHPKLTNSETVAPFISMAYTLSPVPELDEPERSVDLPGDLLEVLDYAPLVREFYRRSRIAQNLDEYVKIYQKAGDQMKPSAALMVSNLLDFLHTKPDLVYTEKVKTKGASKNKKKKLESTELVRRERRFFIVPEMLAPNDTLNFRNIQDNYYAIVSPGTDFANSATRRAYLQFVFDPLIIDNAKDVLEKTDSIRVLLNQQRQNNPNVSPDVFLAVSRSAVVAADVKEIESRKINVATNEARQKLKQLKTDAEKRAVTAELANFKQNLQDETALELSEAYKNGAVLAFYFAKQFDGLADSGFDVAASIKDIIFSIDATQETSRIAEFKEASERAAKRREEKPANNTASILIRENPVTAKLLDIEKTIEAKNYTKAAIELKSLLAKNPDPRIHYALGRVTSLSAESTNDEDEQTKKLAEAELFYSNAIRASTKETDTELISLSYLAIGRIYEFRGQSSNAVKIYQQALKFANSSGDTYKQASDAIERLSKDQ